MCAGDGKTHYIKEQLRTSPAQLTIAVNEAFTPLKAIFKLRTLPINQWGASVFFNFTMLPPGVKYLVHTLKACMVYLEEYIFLTCNVHALLPNNKPFVNVLKNLLG